jgi:4-hydroxybenzoate polyprenyltransferase
MASVQGAAPNQAAALKKLTDLLFYSSIFISLCGLALTAETYLVARIPLDGRVGFLIFFATLFLYNLDSLLPYKTGQQLFLSERKKWIFGHRKLLLIMAVFSGLMVLALYTQLYQQVPFWFFIPFLVISVFYSLPVLPTTKGFIPLRDVPLLKVFLVALVWSGLTVLLPLLVSGVAIGPEEIYRFLLRRFLFIFALTLLFDIRDVQKDKRTGTVTFPGKFGVPFAKILSLSALAFFILLTLFQETGNERVALVLSAVFAGIVVAFSEEERPDYYYAGLADGMMLLQFLLVWLFMA